MKVDLRHQLLGLGANVVGVASLRGHMSGELAHLEIAVSIGVDRRLNEDTLSQLMKLQKRAVLFLKSRGYRTLAIPPDSDRQKGTFISKLYSLFTHKMAATSAGPSSAPWTPKSEINKREATARPERMKKLFGD